MYDSAHGTAAAGQLSAATEQQIVAGRYQLVRLIGEGGMGAVYEARNVVTLKRCALKLLLSPELARNQELVRRFFREAQASSVIESDHIVQVYDSGADATTGHPYMVMEFLQGEDLEHTLERLGALEPLVAAKLVLQAATGLARAHEMGIIHRDIKPANLFLSVRDSGELVVKLLDFGIAKIKMENFAQTSAGGHGLTRTGSMLGTPLYMSPEQAKGASNVDARSDVWSLGIALYQLLSGRVPYEDTSSLGELMVNIITGETPLLQSLAPWVPPELAEVVHRAISRDISKRYQHAGELRDALAAITPDGPRTTPDMLVGVAPAARNFIAPKLKLSDEGLLKATTRTGLAITAAGTESRKTGPAAILAAVGVLVVVGLGAAGAITWRMRAQNQPDTITAVAPSLSAPAVSAPVAPAPVERKTFQLEVAPEGVLVTLDGQAVEVTDGRIQISGKPGETHKVKASLGGKDIEQTVAITEDGILPARVELPVPVAVAPPASTGKSGGGGKKQREPPAATTAPATATAAKPPRVIANTDEFDR